LFEEEENKPRTGPLYVYSGPGRFMIEQSSKRF
jgi:hypothetical protein